MKNKRVYLFVALLILFLGFFFMSGVLDLNIDLSTEAKNINKKIPNQIK